MENTDNLNSITPNQKYAIGLLSIGTFLEYFDLMLYVHMAVLLNELFFPKTDPHTASILAASAFCSTYVLRPFGALIFGYLGDNIGRKSTVIITTFIMSLSCLVMANLPTYEQIGITAAVVVTICRILQGMSSMGEGTGAELYLTETTTPPARYPVVATIVVSASIGTTAALGMASLVTSYNLNWRLAFWIGAIVALIGTVARTTLRETPDFADAKRRIQKVVKDAKEDPGILESSPIWQEQVNKKTALSLFLIQCLWPACLYFAYIHCGNVLKSTFGLTPEQVIHQNFIVAMGQLVSYLLLTYLSYKVYPLNILKVKLAIFATFMLVCPYLLGHIDSSFQLLLIQLFVVIFVPTDFPAASIFYVHFPVFKRFTYASLMYALSRALMSVITSFGIVYLIDYFGHWGILVIMVPIILGYRFGLSHFQRLEQELAYGSQKKTSALYLKKAHPAG